MLVVYTDLLDTSRRSAFKVRHMEAILLYVHPRESVSPPRAKVSVNETEFNSAASSSIKPSMNFYFTISDLQVSEILCSRKCAARY